MHTNTHIHTSHEYSWIFNTTCVSNLATKTIKKKKWMIIRSHTPLLNPSLLVSQFVPSINPSIELLFYIIYIYIDVLVFFSSYPHSSISIFFRSLVKKIKKKNIQVPISQYSCYLFSNHAHIVWCVFLGLLFISTMSSRKCTIVV